jgi:hypothetical protein
MSDFLSFSGNPAQDLWLILLLGVSIFGVTAAIGFLLIGRRPREESAPAAANDQPNKVLEPLRDIGERRQSFRRKGTPLKVDVADREHQGIHEAWVVDRSTGGLGLHMDGPLPRGAVVKLRPRQAPGTDLWVLMVVMNCRQEEDYYVVGCQFVEEPPIGVLRLFG